jgi:hypothetical protein
VGELAISIPSLCYRCDGGVFEVAMPLCVLVLYNGRRLSGDCVVAMVTAVVLSIAHTVGNCR